MEPNPDQLTALDYIIYVVGAITAAFLAYIGKNKKIENPPTIATLSGALMDNRAVDPLLKELRELNSLLRMWVDMELEEAKKADLKHEIEKERVMEELLEQLARGKGKEG